MRILIGHNFYNIPGGEDTVVRAEIELLRLNGQEVLTYERHNQEFEKLNPFAKMQRLLSFGYNRQAYQELRGILRQHRPQVAHFHNIYYMMTPAVYQACRDEQVPVVQSLHNFRMMCSNGLLYRDGHVCEDCLKKNVWEGVKNRCFRDSALITALMASSLEKFNKNQVWTRNVDRYIVAAEFTRRKHVDFGIPIEKIVYKPHFVHPDSGRRQLDAGYALYLGRLSQEKGVDVLLNAWQILKDIPLKIVGGGPMEKSLKDFVSTNKLDRVEFTGFLSQAQSQLLLREARVLVVPSKCYENFPRVVVEAYVSGVPIIASRLGSLAELIQDGQTGLLVEPGNPQALSQAVRFCFENPLKTTHMGENARKVFEEKYSAQTNYRRLMEIYESVIRDTRHQNN